MLEKICTQNNDANIGSVAGAVHSVRGGEGGGSLVPRLGFEARARARVYSEREAN